MTKITVGFTLDTEKDKRIVRWLEGLERGQKSKAIREALHAALGKGSVSLGDIYQAIQELKRSGVVVAQSANPESEMDIPADVLEKLDGLGL